MSRSIKLNYPIFDTNSKRCRMVTQGHGIFSPENPFCLVWGCSKTMAVIVLKMPAVVNILIVACQWDRNNIFSYAWQISQWKFFFLRWKCVRALVLFSLWWLGCLCRNLLDHLDSSLFFSLSALFRSNGELFHCWHITNKKVEIVVICINWHANSSLFLAFVCVCVCVSVRFCHFRIGKRTTIKSSTQFRYLQHIEMIKLSWVFT